MNNDKQYTNINQIIKEFINEWEEEQKPFLTHKQNSKEFINEARQEYLSEWITNHFIYTRDILNLLFNNIVNLNDLDNTLNNFDGKIVSLEQAILITLEENLTEEIEG